jgi:hypothetical protein
MEDAHNPYEFETYAMGENMQVRNAKTKSNGCRNQRLLQLLQNYEELEGGASKLQSRQ